MQQSSPQFKSSVNSTQSPPNIHYAPSRGSNILYRPKLTLHSQSLLYLHHSRCSFQQQFPSPYLSSRFPQYTNGLLQRPELYEKYSELTNYFTRLQEEDKNIEEELGELKKLVFLALGLKVSSQEGEIWSQEVWGTQHYVKVVAIIVGEIKELDKRNQMVELKKENFRIEFIRELENKAYEVVQGDNHPNGIKELVHQQVYCFVAEYLNFSDNQVFNKKQKENNEQIYKKKNSLDENIKRMKLQ